MVKVKRLEEVDAGDGEGGRRAALPPEVERLITESPLLIGWAKVTNFFLVRRSGSWTSSKKQDQWPPPTTSAPPLAFSFREIIMDPAKPKYLEDEDSPVVKTIKGATMGLVAGNIWGTVIATWYDVPRVERKVALPGLIKTLKLMGNHGFTFAAIGGVFIGVEQVLQHYRMKKDFVNGAVGGFVAGASVFGLKGRSISTAISAGAALAFTSSMVDIGGQTTRVPVEDKEYYPYTLKKRPSINN